MSEYGGWVSELAQLGEAGQKGLLAVGAEVDNDLVVGGDALDADDGARAELRVFDPLAHGVAAR